MSNFEHMTIVRYKDIPNWSVQYVVDSSLNFTCKYSMVKIGTFLIKSKDIIEVCDDVEYKQVTLKINNGGVVPRNNGATIKGSAIGTRRQTVVHTGQFIMSKIDARNGAFGIVPESLEGAIVTNDFPVFDVNTKKILPQFLVLISTTPQFVNFVKKCSSGTTNRKRMDVSAFLNQSIPLPKLEQQHMILDEYNKKCIQAQELVLESQSIYANINNILHDRLQFSCSKNLDNSKLKIVRFKNLSRWDVTFNSSKNKIRSLFPTISLRECISHFMEDDNGTSLRTETYNTPSKEFQYIGMENIEKGTGKLLSLPVVHGNDIKSQTVRVPKGFYIYGKLRPYLNKYWENNIDAQDIVCSSEFFTFKPSNSILNSYFKIILSSYIIQDQIADAMSGARMPRINENTFFNIRIPLPSPERQLSIASQIENMMLKSSQKIETANSLRMEAMETFAKCIFD